MKDHQRNALFAFLMIVVFIAVVLALIGSYTADQEDKADRARLHSLTPNTLLAL